jgi:hypothetical protein
MLTQAHQRKAIILIWCIIVPSLFVTFANGAGGGVNVPPRSFFNPACGCGRVCPG